MGYLSEQVAYLKGLAEGMKVDEKSDEGKVLSKMLDILGEMASNFEDLSDEMLENSSRIDSLEELTDDMAADLDECLGECGEGCSCGGHGEEEEDFFDELDDEDLEDLDFYEIVCPNCHEKVYFDEDMIDEKNLVCPNCKERIEIEITDDEEDGE